MPARRNASVATGTIYPIQKYRLTRHGIIQCLSIGEFIFSQDLIPAASQDPLLSIVLTCEFGYQLRSVFGRCADGEVDILSA